MSNLVNAIRHPIETIRTAPLGAGLLALNSINPVLTLVEVANEQEIDPSSLQLTPVAIGGLACAGYLINRQLRLRDKMASILDRRGYSSRAFATTTDEWCARQTVRTMLRDTEYFDDYVQLCEQREDSAQLTWIPHF